MSKTFSNIKITGIDESASHKPRISESLYNIILNLSAAVPYEWEDYFNNTWKQHVYMMKCRAFVAGDKLTVYTIPEELEMLHIAELKKVIDKTNKQYKKYLSGIKIQAEYKKKESDAQKAALHRLNKNLKF